MRIMQFCTVFSWGPTFGSWAHFGCFFESPGKPSWSKVGPIWTSVGPLGGFLGVLGSLLGTLWDQFGLQLGDFVPSWKPCDANLGDSVPLGVRFGFFWVSGLRIKFLLPYLWMPLVEFVGIGEAGLDLCQCVSIGAELHTKPNAHTCTTYLYMCTC